MILVRWMSNKPGSGYEAYLETTNKWIPITREEIAQLLAAQEVIHYNPGARR